MHVKAKQAQTRNRVCCRGDAWVLPAFIKRNKLANCMYLDLEWLILDDIQESFRIFRVCGRKLESLCVCPCMNNSQSLRGVCQTSLTVVAPRSSSLFVMTNCLDRVRQGILSLTLTLAQWSIFFVTALPLHLPFSPLCISSPPVMLHRGKHGLLFVRLTAIAT